MSDKSFGDHTNRNIVKNPLLSSAVTGLSLEDLTHKAVLLPVNPSLDQITRSDQQEGSHTHTLAHPQCETPTLPSGDAFSNIALSNIPQTTNQKVLDNKKNVNLEGNRNAQNATQSKASARSDDDFDVNEYIARLQGTRYVSAPLHSHLKEDQNTNLEATEEHLEEINLNESIPLASQQSLTADIAQNLSQLPTVLPHVASAVFSSFSNMLNYKSREQTPDHPRVADQGNRGGYEEVQFQRPDVGIPLVGVDEYKAPKEVAPPPKEPPSGGTSNFRITTKKKYAQIPGLSSGDTAQTIKYPPVQNMPPYGQSIPIDPNMTLGQNTQYFDQNMLPVGQNMPPVGQNMSQFDQNILSFSQNPSRSVLDTPHSQASLTQHAQNLPPFAQNVPFASQNVSKIDHLPPIGHSGPQFVQITPIVGQNEPYLNPNIINEPKVTADEIKSQESNVKTQSIAEKQSLYNIFNPAAENVSESKAVMDIQSNLLPDNQNYFTPVELKDQNIPPNARNSAIIPPPPMFSNLPRRGSQSSIGKSVLPPSVARRISANHPIVKPAVSTQSFTENIFVPAPMPDVIESVQADNSFTSGYSSAFVPAYNPSLKSDPIKLPSNLPPPLHIVSSSISQPVESVGPATYFIPSNETKSSLGETSTIFTPEETASAGNTFSSSVPEIFTPSLSSVLPTSAVTPISSYRSTDLNLRASSYASTNMPPASSIFIPSNVATKLQEEPPLNLQSPPVNTPTQTFFSPRQVESSAPHPVTQMLPMAATEVLNPIPEPPKATGNVNFRMTKKRPQYYAGPIKGVGAIGNNVKPIIAPVMPSAMSVEPSSFQGTLFCPQEQIPPIAEQYSAPSTEHASVPFDLSRPMEQETLHAPFDISKSQEYDYGTSLNMRQPESQNYEQEYNTPFDMSRDPTDLYNQPKQESRGFGIIGSLKSKLSSIDINKIQSTVTTFFDPAYNDTKVAEPIAQDSAHYKQQPFLQTTREQSSFDIFVPTVEPNQYSKSTHDFDYSHNNQYQQTQGPNQNTPSYSTSSYFSDSNYSTEQVHTSNPLYDNTQISHPTASYNPQGNIPEKLETLSIETTKTDHTSFYGSNAYSQENTSKSLQQPTSDFNTYQYKEKSITNQQNLNYFNPDMKTNTGNLTSTDSPLSADQQKSVFVSPDDTSNMTFYNPNAFAQENRQIWAPQPSHDNVENLSQPFDQHQKNVIPYESGKQEAIIYNPNTFAEEIAHISKPHQLLESNIQENTGIQEDITANIQTTLSESVKVSPPSDCDSALNTSKYNIASLQPHSAPLLPAASFFDNPISTSLSQYPKDSEIVIKTTLTSKTTDNQPIELQKEQIETKYPKIGKIQDDIFTDICTKSQYNIAGAGESNKDINVEMEQQVKQSNLIESISKDNIPVLSVSTVPLFGLSAMIANKSNEGSNLKISEKSIFDTIHQSNLFDSKTAASFFGGKETENKIISETQVKKAPLDFTALSIDDVKNVLVIEPPQENIGALLKRNVSSNKLDNLPEQLLEEIEGQNDAITNQVYHEKVKLNLDENTTDIYFKHSENIVRELKEENSQIDANMVEEHSELNICETCREVGTPEHEPKHKETEDLTSQLIENITSPLQLSHPLTVPLKESDTPIVERSPYDGQQLDEITQVAEETFETLQVQSATELLDKRTTSEVRDYGWTTEETVYPVVPHGDHDYATKIDSDTISVKHNYGLELDASNFGQGYEFELDPNAIDFFDNNSLFFDNVPVPTNASDEIKAEIKHSHEDIVLPRQMSIPTAPPKEEDTKLDEPGVLDVHSIEQDAKKDFPLEEEFIIEPSTDEFLSTDDDKIEFRERKRSSEDSTSNDTFTNRVERFKKTNDILDDSSSEQIHGSPPLSMASYFDTGNYAVESHYRNSLMTMRIPPGFEEEYARRISGLSLLSENTTEPYIPDTSTQTRPINTPTYSSPIDAKQNIIGSELSKENTEALVQAFTESQAEEKITQSIEKPNIVANALSIPFEFADTTTRNVQSLSDPMNFFSSNVEEPKMVEPAAEESFSRLASYFSMPPAQPEHSKSFFELSQSQNHYKHEPKNQEKQKPFFELSQSQNHYIDDDTKNNIKELMKDLTSPKYTKEQTFKIVNYFTVELDNEIKCNNTATPINIKLDEFNINKNLNSEKELMENDSKVKNKTKLSENNSRVKISNVNKEKGSKPVDNDTKVDDNDSDVIMSCEYCRRYIPEINTKVFNVKTAVNDRTESSNESGMSTQKDNSERTGNSVNFADFDVEKQPYSSVSIANEHRVTSEYTPVRHHWFYRREVEEKSVWRGFSNSDSQALEDAYNSPDLNESTVVATDGGRYDVNIVGRLRLAVYWKEKPTNVRRCSWFYKGTTDARYVPYTELVADKLEEEYRHGVTTGEWHRKMVLPNSEMVIMHGPSVMVHFLHSGATDAFTTPPSLLGKRVYRNPPKLRVARDQKPKIDHLILLVHGAGEYKDIRFSDQAASRPRVVRRSHEESEIEECEPSKVDHLLLLCHGVGSACDMRFRSVEEVVEDFRTTSLQLLQSHYRNSYDSGLVSRVEVLPISWHEQLHAGESGVDRRLARVTLDSIPRLRAFTNHTVLDVLFYTSPVFHQTIIDTVCYELNRVYSMFRERNPHFKGTVSLGGHSLGSVILYDLLCHQAPETPLELGKSPDPENRHVSGSSGTGQPDNYPQLVFPPAALYALGSPIAIFECIRGVESLGTDFALPTCKNFFNIFHPYDPIAYRIEPLINPQLQQLKPSQIPHHKGRKRMHLGPVKLHIMPSKFFYLRKKELKDTMARVGADLKQKLVDSLRSTWNKWKATPPTDGQLEKVVEEEMEKEQLTNEEEPANEVQATSEMLGRLNGGRRVDYVLQEAPLEMINEYLFAMSSHVGYWESEDTMLLMLREIYGALGVQPDCTVPQPGMTVQRTRTVEQDETTKLINEADTPSTSRGGT